jgi:hypothetical protein
LCNQSYNDDPARTPPAHMLLVDPSPTYYLKRGDMRFCNTFCWKRWQHRLPYNLTTTLCNPSSPMIIGTGQRHAFQKNAAQELSNIKKLTKAKIN